jgi:hypothetical protein
MSDSWFCAIAAAIRRGRADGEKVVQVYCHFLLVGDIRAMGKRATLSCNADFPCYVFHKTTNHLIRQAYLRLKSNGIDLSVSPDPLRASVIYF